MQPLHIFYIFIKMKKTLISALFHIVLLCGCASSRLALFTVPVSPNVNLYYMPMTEWQPMKGTSLKAELDFTYRNEEGSPAICNVSVFSQEVLPKEVSAASLESENATGSFQEIEQLLMRPEMKELRVTTKVDIEDFVRVLESREIVFVCRVDGENGRYKAPKDFYHYAEQFLRSLGRK